MMQTQVQRTVSGCFTVLRQLRQIRNFVPTATFQSLVVALVLSRLDWKNCADLWFVSLIYLVDSLFALLALAACWCHLFFKLSAIGTQAFPGASPRVWTSLPADITSALSLSTFH